MAYTDLAYVKSKAKKFKLKQKTAANYIREMRLHLPEGRPDKVPRRFREEVGPELDEMSQFLSSGR